MTNILVRPPELRQISEQLRSSAKKIGTALQSIDTDILSLKGNQFLGNRANAVQAHYAPKRDALIKAKEIVAHFSEDLETAAVRFEQADGNRNNLDVLPETGGSQTPNPTPTPTEYTNGASGYVVADTYTIPPYLTMRDNQKYCTVVAFFRNLYMQGVEVSEVDFGKAMEYFKGKYSAGYVPFGKIAEYLKEHVSETKDFMQWDPNFPDPLHIHPEDWVSDKAGAEKFLIEQLKSGKPIMVGYLDNVDKLGSGHAGNIIGVDLDSEGKIISVRLDNGSYDVGTGENTWEQTIEWNVFAKQWMRNGGEALVLK